MAGRLAGWSQTTWWRPVVRLVSVMGRRPGHIFHPSEGEGDGILFGHGPVFRDLNFDLDREVRFSSYA